MKVIISELGSSYGYQIHKTYTERFGRVTRECVYYHLKKGVDLGLFRITDIRREKGRFSWGGVAEKKYYSLA